MVIEDLQFGMEELIEKSLNGFDARISPKALAQFLGKMKEREAKNTDTLVWALWMAHRCVKGFKTATRQY